jgi:hypothetical protein
MTGRSDAGPHVGGQDVLLALAVVLPSAAFVAVAVAVPLGVSGFALPPFVGGLPAGFGLPPGGHPVGVPAPVLVVGVLSAALLSGLTATFRSPSQKVRAGSVAVASLATAAGAGLASGNPRFSALLLAAGLLAGAGVGFGARFLERLLPPLALGRWRLAAALVVSLAVVLQTGRLAVFIADPSHTGASMLPPLQTRHSCLTGPLEAAARASEGSPNVYAAALFPDPRQPPESWPTPALDTRPFAIEPFVWAPHFLLVAVALLRLGGSFLGARALWFALEGVFLLLGLLALALQAPAPNRRRTLLASGLICLSPAVLLTLQIGNAQLLCLSLSALGLVALRHERRWLGAVLLSLGILTKLFPAVLLVELAARRRWRDLGTVAAVLVAATAALLLFVGTAPLTSFVLYHLPRLASGAAHPLALQAESLPVNHSLPTLLPRLEALFGLEVPAGLSSASHVCFSVGVVLWAWWCGRRGERDWRGLLRSLAVLNLASLLGHISAYPYSVVGTLVLLGLVASGRLAGPVVRRRGLLALAGLAGAILSVSPRFATLESNIAYGLVVQLMALSSNLLVLLWPERRAIRVQAGTDVLPPVGQVPAPMAAR